jgi:hypothetical protein
MLQVLHDPPAENSMLSFVFKRWQHIPDFTEVAILVIQETLAAMAMGDCFLPEIS